MAISPNRMLSFGTMATAGVVPNSWRILAQISGVAVLTKYLSSNAMPSGYRRLQTFHKLSLFKGHLVPNFNEGRHDHGTIGPKQWMCQYRLARSVLSNQS